MKLYRTLNAPTPGQPLIQWEGDVRGIIAALHAKEAAGGAARLRLRMIRRVIHVRPILRVRVVPLMEAAA